MNKRRRERIDRRKALAEWSKAIRAGGKCEVCGEADKVLNAHHLLPKEKYPELRLVLDNGLCLCPRCHKFGRYSFHRNPIWGTEWLRVNKPTQFAWCLANI